MAIKITEGNYQKYKEIFEVFWHHYFLLLPTELKNGPSPINFLNNLESQSKPLARGSLQSGFSDIVFMVQDLPKETLHVINKDLEARGLPIFETIKNEVNDTLGKVLKRGKIKNLNEYYIIKEYECDMANELTDQDRQILTNCLSDFENKSKPTG